MIPFHDLTPKQTVRLLNALENDDVREVLLPILFKHIETKRTQLELGDFEQPRREDMLRGAIEFGSDIIRLHDQVQKTVEEMGEEFQDDDADSEEEILHVGTKSD